MTDLTRFSNTVAGREVQAEGSATFESFDPFTGAPWAAIPRCSPADVDAAVQAARTDYRSPGWRGMTHT